ncbi:MAG: Rrf2 family transcriptional regulator [bacterium]
MHVPPIISQTVQYAIQSLVYLAAHRDQQPILGHEIAGAVGIPANYLSKIMHTLGKTGLIEAKRGRTGGYRFAREPEGISLMEVYAAFDDPGALDECFLGRPECSDEDPCAVHEAWAPIARELKEFLEQNTIGGLSTSAGSLTR